MDINIKITFGEKELKHFGGLVEAMTTLAEAQKAETTKETAPTAEPPQDRATPAPATETAGPDPEELLRDIRAMIRQNVRSHRDEIKSLLAEYNAPKASLLPSEVRLQFYEKLKAVVAA